MYQKPKLKSFTLGNKEEAFVFKDPPKSIYTRKYEPVSESDVMFMLRSGDEAAVSRLSENINYIAKGTNPMTDVNFSNSANNGAKTLHLRQNPTTLPYKIEVVRPPLFPLDSLQPLSRAKYLDPAATTNPGLTDYNAGGNVVLQFDTTAMKSAVAGPRNTTYVSAIPSATYNVSLPQDIFGDRTKIRNTAPASNWQNYSKGSLDTAGITTQLRSEILPNGTIILSPLAAGAVNTKVSAPSFETTQNLRDQQNAHAVKSADKMLILNNITPNFEILLNDAVTKINTPLTGAIQEKNNIAVNAAVGSPLELTDNRTNEKVKIKDYRWKIIRSAAGNDQLVLSVTPVGDLTQQTLRDLVLPSKTSPGIVQTAKHNTDWNNQHLNSAITANHTKTPIHLAMSSNFQNSALENHDFQGGNNMGDRQQAIMKKHLQRDKMRAKSSDTGRVLSSSAIMPYEPLREIRLKKESEKVAV